MVEIIATTRRGGGILWHNATAIHGRSDEGICFWIRVHFKAGEVLLLAYLFDELRSNGAKWLINGGRAWLVDLDALRLAFPQLTDLKWMKGQTRVTPEVVARNGNECTITLTLHPEFMNADDSAHEGMPRQIMINPNTAFILMWMDSDKPELEDVSECFKSVFNEFGVRALRADDVEHQDVITDVILQHIRSAEFLIADLTGERPNVYYEIGYAHSLSKKPILFRRTGTRLHFDLSVHNVPEYRNVTELRTLLTKRLEAITGRMAKDVSGTKKGSSSARRRRAATKASTASSRSATARASRSNASSCR